MGDEKEMRPERAIKERVRRLQAEAYRPAVFYTDFEEASGSAEIPNFFTLHDSDWWEDTPLTTSLE